ncbi:MAG: HAD hydrolase family protein [Deltaproteobacteria bacterium]|nr:HAD hydrolase family protein [Deltaproteobacteria bacterium]MCL5277230.1 HAD hydrolase family protein [Deltaproteobacteria bacterium]
MDSFDELKAYLPDVEVIATDVDDTLTIGGLLTSDVVRGIEYINGIGKRVILVTGRSGGACTTLSQYLPVEAVIAENGGVVIRDHDIAPVRLPGDHTSRLERCFQEIVGEFPGMRQAQDNPFRLTDRSIDNLSIPGYAYEEIRRIAHSYGLTITVSSVQTHILSPECSKAAALGAVVGGRSTITIGDSANDESMFDREFFPLSVGVANVRNYLDTMEHRPRWIMSKEQGHGFIEFVEILRSAVRARADRP